MHDNDARPWPFTASLILISCTSICMKYRVYCINIKVFIYRLYDGNVFMRFCEAVFILTGSTQSSLFISEPQTTQKLHTFTFLLNQYMCAICAATQLTSTVVTINVKIMFAIFTFHIFPLWCRPFSVIAICS